MKFIWDDGGRIASGKCGHHIKPVSDCVVRAICVAEQLEYDIVLDMLQVYVNKNIDNGIYTKYGNPVCSSEGRGYTQWVYESVLTDLGYSIYTYEACNRPLVADMDLPNCIVRMRQHIAAIVDGNLHDLLNRTGWTIFGYYVKET